MAVETAAWAVCVAEAAETAAVGLVAAAAEAARMEVREAVESAQGSLASLHHLRWWPPRAFRRAVLGSSAPIAV